METAVVLTGALLALASPIIGIAAAVIVYRNRDLTTFLRVIGALIVGFGIFDLALTIGRALLRRSWGPLVDPFVEALAPLTGG